MDGPHARMRTLCAALVVCCAGCQVVQLPPALVTALANSAEVRKESVWTPVLRHELAHVSWKRPPRSLWLERSLEPQIAIDSLSLPVWEPELASTSAASQSDRITLTARQTALAEAWRSRSQRMVANVSPLSNDHAEQIRAALQLFREADPVGDLAVILVARNHPAQSAALLPSLVDIASHSAESRHHRRTEKDADPADSPKPKPDSPQQLATRCAAAETWCLVLESTRDETIDAEPDFTPVGQLLIQPDLPDAVRGTLWQALATQMRPDVIPGVAEAFRRSTRGPLAAVPIRRLAMEACLLHAIAAQSESSPITRTVSAPYEPDRWPDSLWNCRSDPDPLVRQLFGRWLAWSGHPEAVAALKSLLLDSDTHARDEAALSLGLIDSDAARTELRKMLRADAPMQRILGIRGIARQEITMVRGMLKDSIATVRQQAARELCAVPSLEHAILLRDLLVDRQPDVQQTVVESIADWPDDLAIPLVWETLRVSTLATRQAALVVLRDRLGFEPVFPVDAVPLRREEAVRELARDHGLPLNFPSAIAGASIALQPVGSTVQRDPSAIRADVVAWLRSQVNSPESAELLPQLQALTAADVPVLEQTLVEVRLSSAQIEQLWRHVLAPISPGHAALVKLADRDVAARRSAARDLRRLGEGRSFSNVMLQMLAERLANEQDRVVWQECFAAIFEESSQEAAQVAMLTLHHQWPDVRLLGCRYVARHPTPSAAVWLVPLFRDPQRDVRLSAIRVAGACRNPIVIDGLPANPTNQTAAVPGLRSLMTDADGEIRLATVDSLVQLHDDSAVEELMRLALSPTPAIRQQAAKMMGRGGQTRFIETLVQMGWTEKVPAVQEAVLESLQGLVPAENRPGGLAQSGPFSDNMRIWADWWQTRSASSR